MGHMASSLGVTDGNDVDVVAVDHGVLLVPEILPLLSIGVVHHDVVNPIVYEPLENTLALVVGLGSLLGSKAYSPFWMKKSSAEQIARPLV